jgi:hypothetical protein
MDRITARDSRDLKNALDPKVRLGRRGGPDQEGRVGQAHMQRIRVGFGVHSDGL